MTWVAQLVLAQPTVQGFLHTNCTLLRLPHPSPPCLRPVCLPWAPVTTLQSTAASKCPNPSFAPPHAPDSKALLPNDHMSLVQRGGSATGCCGHMLQSCSRTTNKQQAL